MARYFRTSYRTQAENEVGDYVLSLEEASDEVETMGKTRRNNRNAASTACAESEEDVCDEQIGYQGISVVLHEYSPEHLNIFGTESKLANKYDDSGHRKAHEMKAPIGRKYEGHSISDQNPKGYIKDPCEDTFIVLSEENP